MLIVEDGTGKENSNSYVDVEYADAYFLDRGITKWADLQDKAVRLIRGTDFIDNVFKWKGKKKTQEQALHFPRINLLDDDGYTVEGIPDRLKQAVCEASLMSNEGTTLFLNESKKGDIISENIAGQLSFTYDTKTKVKDKSIYGIINYKLRGLYLDTSKGRVISGRIERV